MLKFITEKEYTDLMRELRNNQVWHEHYKKRYEEAQGKADKYLAELTNEGQAYFMFGSKYITSASAFDDTLVHALDNFLGIYESVEAAQKGMDYLLNTGDSFIHDGRYKPVWATIAEIKGNRFHAVKRLFNTDGTVKGYFWRDVEEQTRRFKPGGGMCPHCGGIVGS